MLLIPYPRLLSGSTAECRPLDTTCGRACMVDQVGGDHFAGLLRRELRDRQDGLQQVADVRGRECWQDLQFELLRQLRVTGVGFTPLQLHPGHQPGGGGRQRGVMLPGAILAGLQVSPAQFRFGILVGPLGELPPATAFNQSLSGRRFRRIQHNVGQAALVVAPHLHRLGQGPHRARRKVGDQFATLGVPHRDSLSGRQPAPRERPHFVRHVPTANLQSQVIAQALHRLHGQPPATRVEKIAIIGGN